MAGFICTKNDCYVVENVTRQDERIAREDPYNEIHWRDWQSKWNDPVKTTCSDWAADEVLYEYEF